MAKKPKDTNFPKCINYADGTWITVENDREYNHVMAQDFSSGKEFDIKVWREVEKQKK